MSIIDIKLKRGDYIIVNRDYDFSILSNPDLSMGTNVIPKGTIFQIIEMSDSFHGTGYSYSIDKVKCINGKYKIPHFLTKSDFGKSFDYYTREVNLNKLFDEHC